MTATATPTPGDRARATTFVAVDPLDAFEVFTGETDLWWRRGPRFRFGGKRRGALTLEPGVGGRLFEAFSDAPADVFEVGRVLVWEPGARLLLEWRLPNFAPGERTEVDVRFEASGDGTMVTVEHRGWSAVRDDHPARHGEAVVPFLSRLGQWWGALLLAMRERALLTKGDDVT
ncbi:MAG: SRPBCC domain-containing protein [Byssovorax sp.]